MDEDSSTKFIGSLTKFLQSLCNGYVEFQRGVELVGHIYLNIDTGEKVDYILHEKVSKNDENSVTFVSNSFHAQQSVDKKTAADKDGPYKSNARNRPDDDDDDDDDDDNDIMIVDDHTGVPGSTNTGTVFPRGGKYAGSSGHQGSMNPVSSPQRNRQPMAGASATVTSRDMHQENINIGSVKLEQISNDELLSLASHVEGGSSQRSVGQHGGPARMKRSSSLGEASGQPLWVKQEMPDDIQGDTGWSHGRDGQSDTSNSGSDLYPVMMHQNPAYSSNPVFPGFSSISGQSSSSGSRHGHSQPLPGMSGAVNLYANPMPGTSHGMGGMDPAGHGSALQHIRDFSSLLTHPAGSKTSIIPERIHKKVMRRFHWEKVKEDPARHEKTKRLNNEAVKRYQARKKLERYQAGQIQ